MSKHKPHQNPSGCTDLTSYKALNNITRDERRQRATEAQEQTTLFAWAALNEKRYPALKRLYAIPNGGSRHPAEAANLKRQGVKAGVPDMCLPVARRGYHALYIELKTAAGRVSKAQAEWINSLREDGNAAHVCRGADEGIKVLGWYLGEA